MAIRSTVLTSDLMRAVVSQFRLPLRSPHGPAHWMRVRTNGLYLASETGANPRVVELFALFHDSCRASDGRDPQHGPRGAVLAESMREQALFRCSDAELELLVVACHGHTHERTHADPTIAACWDADRLDLPRVGIVPVPHRLCTRPARRRDVIAAAKARAEAWWARTYL
jgi:uncharacterized protein